MYSMQQENQDWEINDDGLFVATRGYLTRRGYCCANRCQNCPYINWRISHSWQPIKPEDIRRTRVSIKAIAGARTMLQYHEEELTHCRKLERARHQEMIEHYRLLLERWGAYK